jgi:uncharacterized membrane protein
VIALAIICLAVALILIVPPLTYTNRILPRRRGRLRSVVSFADRVRFAWQDYRWAIVAAFAFLVLAAVFAALEAR